MSSQSNSHPDPVHPDPIHPEQVRPNTDTGERRDLRVCFPKDACHTHLLQAKKSTRFHLIQTDNLNDAEIQLLDLPGDFDNKSPSSNSQWELALTQGDLPALVVVKADSDLSELFESTQIDFARIEMISSDELGSSLFDARVMKLLQLKRQSTQQLIQQNAQTILDAVMRHSNDWIVVKSLDHRFLHVSKKFCHGYGKPPEDIIGKNDLEIGTSPELVLGRSGTDWKGYWAMDKEVTDAGDHVVIQPVVLEDGDVEEMRESTDKIPLRDHNGDVFALFVCVSELRQKKIAERSHENISQEDLDSMRFWESKQNLAHSPALMALNDERKRVEALQHESERAFRAKNQFIASASHDLRQPLHALGLYLGALEEKVDGDSRYLVDKLKHCAGSLNELLTSLLDISRLDANVVAADQSNFSVDEMLISLRDECHSIARGKSLDLSCASDGSLVYSDPILLRRVIRNLLMNAINYTDEGKVSVTARRLGSRVNIIISDTGIGIPKDKQELVFEEFAKLDSHSQNSQQGLGLGLSIVKRLCQLLDIKISLQSSVEQGTRVSVLVPLGLSQGSVDTDAQDTDKVDIRSTPQPLKPALADLPDLQKLILVVDDDQEVCEAVETILLQSGYRTISATSPEQAIDKLRSLSLVPNAILVDFRLSEEMTGLDAIAIITDSLGISTPALIVTGDTTNDGLREITESGYRHLHKPVEVDELLTIVDETVNS